MKSPWEEEQIRRGRALLSDKQFDWQAQAKPNSYDIWMRDTQGIYLQDRSRVLQINQVVPPVLPPSPLKADSFWSQLISFIKGFRNIAP